MTKAEGKLAQVTGSNVQIDPEEHYDSWSENYDRDLLGKYGYCAHKIAVQAFAKIHSDRGASVLDVGCGTGLVGIELSQLGYEAIDGVDVSQGMLDKSYSLGIYRKLFHHRIGSSELSDLVGYSGVLCVGSFGLGHMQQEDIKRLIKMAAPKAPIVIFMNSEPFDLQAYYLTLERFSDAGLWVVEQLEDHNYMSALDRPGKLIVGRRV